MGMQGCCIITQGGKVRHLLHATSSHDRVRRYWGLDESDCVSAYYMPVNECDIFKLDRYSLFHRDARLVHGDEVAMRAAKRNCPAWLDDKLWADAAAEMRAAVEAILKGDPIVINCPLRMKGCTETTLPRVWVRDNTSLRYSAIEHLTEGSWFGGGLDLRGTPMTEVAENVTVDGFGTYIPEGETRITPHYGVLNIDGTAIASVPESLVLGEYGIIQAERSALTWAGVPEHLRDRVRGLRRC